MLYLNCLIIFLCVARAHTCNFTISISKNVFVLHLKDFFQTTFAFQLQDFPFQLKDFPFQIQAFPFQHQAFPFQNRDFPFQHQAFPFQYQAFPFQLQAFIIIIYNYYYQFQSQHKVYLFQKIIEMKAFFLNSSRG